jgi:sporulation protein YlmC with PRC-barrel domain
MRKTLAYATLFSTALLGAFAQSAVAADNQQVPMKQEQAQPTKGADANSQLPAGINFVTMQEKAQWRTPKLIGVDVYGADNKKIGKIDDILMGHDGSAQAVVIGVGGFLGIGKKDVGVPFSAIEWKTEPRKVPATDLPPTNPVAPNTTGQTAVPPPPMKETDPAATEAMQGYPDRAILNATEAQLKGAPDFHYAPNPVTQSETLPAGGGETKKTTP